MEIKKLQGAIEAILFASGEAVSLDRIAEALEIDRSTAGKMLENLADRYRTEHGGIRIVRLEGGYQMCTNPEHAAAVRAALEIRRNMPLTQAALEVLAVVAYNQPVSKAFVEQVRGVDCSAVISGLVSKGLVEERGRLELPGRPLLYGTTTDFLRCLGISSLAELPQPQKEQHQEETDAEGSREEVLQQGEGTAE
ncbi:Segregation and condensation protein B [Caprobacter fermentans]|uniref:Segregation and condensation protein B n=1 Tax=Caproicibacter fermentans TaxID=2576756 RepID=A0A6N8I423_9FIRM|nr:SMC-Scp complex subunit ScpB [Caproicibacter fermentans]MVB12886.1 Segregation and condensation protein B [Caproicibacter fermentans]OCN02368.1 SMC-Scp complex subunit ScpB [Clostridium sp. W14A]